MTRAASGLADANPWATRLPVELLKPEAYAPELGSDVELVETHISWVFLLQQDVFKVRKPVNLGFVDFSTLERRKDDCESEVRLNARLAPGVYLGVVAVWSLPSGALRVGGEVSGQIIDWAVHMRRLPEVQRADRLLEAGKLTRAHIVDVAQRIARFHAEQPTNDAIASFGTQSAIWRNVEENFSATQQTLTNYLDEAEAEELVLAQRSFIEQHRGLLTRRALAGKVRDTHGDLRLEHIYLQAGGKVTVLDCIEFSERFRFADVCADIAFLAMDLSRLGRTDLAELLLAAYAEASCDYELYELIDFYQSYRAFVRGKIAALIAEDGAAAAPTRSVAAREARRCFRLALAAERPAMLRPTLFAVGGVIAVGKSTVARQLGQLLPAPNVSADATRKELAGVAAMDPLHVPAWSGVYSPEFTERVYAEVLSRAACVLRSGRSVVIDATFRSAAKRKAARELAASLGANFRFVECVAPADVCRSRLAARAQGQSVSDGRVEIFDEFVASFEPASELAPAEHWVLDTTQASAGAVRQLCTDIDCFVTDEHSALER
jgi:uncharacterized protein